MNYKRIACLALTIALFSCNGKDKRTGIYERHWAQHKYKPQGMIYIDSISNKALIRSEESIDSSASTRFLCYKVSFVDSMAFEPKEKIKWEKYFDYDMQYNWKALINGDSVSVAFFHPMIRKNSMTREGILVFELPKNSHPDTLLYTNTYDTIPVFKTIVLNHKQA